MPAKRLKKKTHKISKISKQKIRKGTKIRTGKSAKKGSKKTGKTAIKKVFKKAVKKAIKKITKKVKHSYEVEIKTLLGAKEKADALRTKLIAMFKDVKLAGKEKQLNHYFHAPTDMKAFANALAALVPKAKKAQFEMIFSEGKKISIRTRDTNGRVLFVAKASVGNDTSANGVQRIEVEFEVPMTLAELDAALIAAGCQYQAKWSREREEYKGKHFSVSIDKNAGYGYLAEFEKVTDDETALNAIRAELASLMKVLGVDELPQDRLERMFAHYNAHWPEYYGTDKTFIIE